MLPDTKSEASVLSIIAFKSFMATPISIGPLSSKTFEYIYP